MMIATIVRFIGPSRSAQPVVSWMRGGTPGSRYSA
jgi:hypothetical protein